MIQIIINWRYYKYKSIFSSSYNWRFKKNCVYFYDYDDLIGFILSSMSESEIWRLKLNIYNSYYKQIKFIKFGECDNNWNVFEWYDLSSEIIEIDNDDFAKLLPSMLLRKKFFNYDPLKEKYYLKWDFINCVKLNVI